MGFFSSIWGHAPRMSTESNNDKPAVSPVITRVYHPPSYTHYQSSISSSSSSSSSNNSSHSSPSPSVSHHHHHHHHAAPVIEPAPTPTPNPPMSVSKTAQNIVSPVIKKAISKVPDKSNDNLTKPIEHSEDNPLSKLRQITIKSGIATGASGIPWAYQGTLTPQQIKQIQNKPATIVLGKKATFSLTGPKPGEVDVNPLRLVAAPIIGAYHLGYYIGENVQGKRSIVQDTERIMSNAYHHPIKTAGNIVKGTLDSISSDPFAYVGDTIALDGVGRVVGGGIKALRDTEPFMKIQSKLQELNPTTDFVVRYAGKGFEPHKGEFKQYLAEFKGDIIYRGNNKVGVVRVQKPSLKHPEAFLDYLKGRRAGQIKRIYIINSKNILFRDTPSEFASVSDELSKAGKLNTLTHSTDNSKFLKKALKKGEFEVTYPTDVPVLDGRQKAGGIELGMFYAPNTNKPIKLEKLGKTIPKDTPQAYIYYAHTNSGSLSDLFHPDTKFSILPSKPGIFMKFDKPDKIPKSLLNAGYRDLSQVLGEDIGHNKLSASTLKGVRTELETIDAPYTKNLVLQKTKIKLPNGEKFDVYIGKTKGLTDTELKTQVKKYIDSKLQRIENIKKYAEENDINPAESNAVIKRELQSIDRLKDRLEPKEREKIIKRTEKYKKEVGNDLDLNQEEREFLNKVDRKVSEEEPRVEYTAREGLRDVFKLFREKKSNSPKNSEPIISFPKFDNSFMSSSPSQNQFTSYKPKNSQTWSPVSHSPSLFDPSNRYWEKDPSKPKPTSPSPSHSGSSMSPSMKEMSFSFENENRQKRDTYHTNNKPQKIKKSSKKSKKKDWMYIGSLTGLVRGLKTDKSLKNITGLEVRPIIIKKE